MTVYQIAASLRDGDAVTQDILIRKHIIENMGFSAEVYAEQVCRTVQEYGIGTFAEMPQIREDDIVILHLTDGSCINRMVTELNCRKILFYRGIPTPAFYRADFPDTASQYLQALQDLSFLRGKFDSCLTDSEAGKDALAACGFRAERITVVPQLFELPLETEQPDAALSQHLSDGLCTVLWTGVIAPHQCLEDLISAFACMQRHQPDTRLILAGTENPFGAYADSLQQYAEALGICHFDIYRKCSKKELFALYRNAHLWVSMSECEFFSVPMAEAMAYDIPVLAYHGEGTAAFLDGAGVLLDRKDAVFVSAVMMRLCADAGLRQSICKQQKERLQAIDIRHGVQMFTAYLRSFMEHFPPLSPPEPLQPYRTLYAMVKDTMQQQGIPMPFSEEALLVSAEKGGEIADVTALLNHNYNVRSFIEAVYLTFYNSLPDETGCPYWEAEAERLGRTAFEHCLVSSAVNSTMRTEKYTRIAFNPFTTAVLQAEETETDAEEAEA